MKLHWGPPPEKDLPADGPWTPLRELTPDRFVIAGSIAGFAVFVGLFELIRRVLALDPLELIDPTTAIVLLLLLPVHEMLHAVVFPGAFRSEDVVVGIWKEKVLPYVMFLGECSRERMMGATLLPFVALTLVPVALASTWPEPWLVALMLFNGAIAGGDLVFAATLAVQLPRGARLRNRGWATYWVPGPESG